MINAVSYRVRLGFRGSEVVFVFNSSLYRDFVEFMECFFLVYSYREFRGIRDYFFKVF